MIMIAVENENEETAEDSLRSMKLIIDSGTTHHMTNSKRYLKQYYESSHTLGELGYACMGDGKFSKIEGYGTKDPFSRVLVVLSLHVPMILSVAHITNMGHTVKIKKDKVTITNMGGVRLLEGYRNSSDLYILDTYTKTKDKWGPLTNIF